ncbi:MAG: PRC-barrel domain-containing protein [Alphaproteobacteria bacterium]
MKTVLMAAAAVLLTAGAASAQYGGPQPATPNRTTSPMLNAPGLNPTGSQMPAQSRPGAPEAAGERNRDPGTAMPPTASTGGAYDAPGTRYAPQTSMPHFPSTGSTVVRVGRLVGQPVFDSEGRMLGRIADVDLYPNTTMAVIAVDGGGATAVPLHYMMHDGSGRLMVNGTRAAIDGIPAYRLY